MNYVAHILLTHPYRDITLGNLIGDMVRNGDLASLDHEVRNGVQVHRTIDLVTDEMDVMRRASVPLRKRHGKYAPVVLDILLDYVLVDRWSEFSDMPFRSAQNWTYDLIKENLKRVPPRVGRSLESMAHHRWLEDYTSRGGFVRVMQRMDRRARFDSYFVEAMHDLDEHWQLLSETLDVVWPVLKETVDDLLNPRNAERS